MGSPQRCNGEVENPEMTLVLQGHGESRHTHGSSCVHKHVESTAQREREIYESGYSSLIVLYDSQCNTMKYVRQREREEERERGRERERERERFDNGDVRNASTLHVHVYT